MLDFSSPNFKHDYQTAPVINAAQLGGIETSTLDNGPGNGVRIAWVNTGGGLRYKVVLDRGMDIADAEFMGQSLAWHSFGGITSPRPAYHQGIEWLRGFYGGLVVSCGPQNVGGPVEVDGQSYNLHGTHSNTPALVESIINPNLKTGQLEMRISGIIKTSRIFGPNVELRRTITSQLGVSGLQIEDQFTNFGDQVVRFAWLMHINMGYPLLEPGASTFCYDGQVTPLEGAEAWFRDGNDYKNVPQPLEAHRGAGEYCGYISPRVNDSKNVIVGAVNHKRGFGMAIEYSKKDFPQLVNWQHWGSMGEFVAALEPSTSKLGAHALQEAMGPTNQLAAGEVRTLRCKITATTAIDQLLKLNG